MYRYVFTVSITMSLIGMDTPPVPLLVKDLIKHQFVPHLTLQEMSRFNRICKGYKNYFDLEKEYSLYACARLQELPYDTRTKILAHYKKTKNKAMFDFVYKWDREIRSLERELVDQYAPIRYKKYRTIKKIHKQRFEQLELALRWNNKKELSILKMILQGSSFNIFNVKYRKKMVRLMCDCCTLRCLFSAICSHDDVDLLLITLGGIIEPRAFKYVFDYAGSSLMKNLIAKNAFIEGVPDKRGRDYGFYKQNYYNPMFIALPMGTRKRSKHCADISRWCYSYFSSSSL